MPNAKCSYQLINLSRLQDLKTETRFKNEPQTPVEEVSFAMISADRYVNETAAEATAFTYERNHQEHARAISRVKGKTAERIVLVPGERDILRTRERNELHGDAMMPRRTRFATFSQIIVSKNDSERLGLRKFCIQVHGFKKTDGVERERGGGRGEKRDCNSRCNNGLDEGANTRNADVTRESQ